MLHSCWTCDLCFFLPVTCRYRSSKAFKQMLNFKQVNVLMEVILVLNGKHVFKHPSRISHGMAWEILEKSNIIYCIFPIS